MLKRIAQNRGRLLLLAVVVLVTLCAGLNPKGYNFRNNVKWAEDGQGIGFEIHGTACTEPFITKDLAATFNAEGFTLEIALNGLERPQEGFAFIAQFHAGDEESQLVLGQWADNLIMMNGNDYQHRLRTPRISMKLPSATVGDHFFAVTSGPGGTRFYLDGRIVSEKAGLVLNIPGAREQGRLVLGNSAYGINPWQGIVRGLALHQGVLDVRQIQRDGEQRHNATVVSSADLKNAVLFYDFTGTIGQVAQNRAATGRDLHFFRSDVIIERRFFESPFHQFEFNRSFVSDTIVNLFGFIPFGLALSLVLHGFGIGRRRNVVIVILAAAVLSFGIELVQAWMPSRSSSALDLILNSAGGFLGALGLAWLVSNGGRIRQSNGA